ncbi:hypothetical protein FIU15_13780 [Staphylococcus aureus]|uniref:hypothetical protein n=1 Tax=Staphylococcus aureus TaxID=1280 RepID=UPI001122645F|nr:hypothetical protein [Staphylococcus aureus]TNX67213.1 hypothetical protein FIU15_13780 [Staphylococcus aureus]
MSKRLFTEDEIADLKLNKFVQNVTPKAITYKEEFREHFVEEYENGNCLQKFLERLDLTLKS